MTERAWKRSERILAAALGGERVPVTGRARGSAPDIKHPWLAIEVKARSVVPKWLRGAVTQAQASAQPGQLPIAIVHRAGDRHSRALVLMTLSDFESWFGPAAPPESEEWTPPKGNRGWGARPGAVPDTSQMTKGG